MSLTFNAFFSFQKLYTILIKCKIYFYVEISGHSFTPRKTMGFFVCNDIIPGNSLLIIVILLPLSATLLFRHFLSARGSPVSDPWLISGSWNPAQCWSLTQETQDTCNLYLGHPHLHYPLRSGIAREISRKWIYDPNVTVSTLVLMNLLAP